MRTFEENCKVQVFVDGIGDTVAVHREGHLWVGKMDLGTPEYFDSGLPGMNGIMCDPDPMTGAPQFVVELTEYEIQLLARALMLDEQVMDEMKSAPLAKLRNVLEA